MKKSILFVAIITAASFTSCKKDRTCTCTDTTVTTTTTTLPGQTPKTTSKTETGAGMRTFTKARKGDAKSACISFKKTEDGSTPPYATWTSEETVDCTLK
jgi:hypothetical protein